MNNDIEFLITTCQRQEMCNVLVKSLLPYGKVTIINDGCDYQINGATHIHNQRRLGKNGYWSTINTLFAARDKKKYYFVLPDDFIPVDGGIHRAIDIWENIKDNKKICLNLYADRMGGSCWTGFSPTDMGDVFLTQWVDMCFICEGLFFKLLGKIPPLGSLSQDVRPKNGSSGVGKYISKFFYDKGYNLYQVKNSLFSWQQDHWISKMSEHEQVG